MKLFRKKIIFINDNFTKHKNYIKVQRLYLAKFKSKTAPNQKKILIIIIEKKTDLVDRKRIFILARKRHVPTEYLINSIKNLFV